MRVVPTRYGALFYQGRTILSKTLSRPGPVHDIYDVMACCAALLAGGPRLAMLGFAGGGILGPLRAAGCGASIDAVDLTRDGEDDFRRLAGSWCGPVRLECDDAADWLRRRRARFDLILEDLTVNRRLGPSKPDLSLGPLPALMNRRLAAGGAVVINALPVPGRTWAQILDRMAAPFPHAVQIGFEEFHNRLVAAGPGLPDAAVLSRRLAAALRRIGSRMVSQYSVRTLRRS